MKGKTDIHEFVQKLLTIVATINRWGITIPCCSVDACNRSTPWKLLSFSKKIWDRFCANWFRSRADRQHRLDLRPHADCYHWQLRQKALD